MRSVYTRGMFMHARSLPLAVVLLLSACATTNYDYPKQASYSLGDTTDTSLGRSIEPLVAQHEAGESGFYLQTDGINSIASRFYLASRAEKSIDAQYYLITDDMVGILFIRALLRAADRGVRVRLLVDDIQTQGYDAGMAALDSHPNFEVRVFNPWSARGLRVLNAGSFSSLNRRMHNKSFTIDNQITIIGGRNIADEYFGARQDVNFGDVDVLSIGPVVNDVSSMFDQYWNSTKAMPVPAFAKMPDDPAAALEKLRARMEKTREDARQTRYGEAVLEDIGNYVEATADSFIWAPYELAYDSPDKADKKLADGATKITSRLADVVATAESQLIIISPYFVPRKKGVEYLGELVSRGIDVTVITNSLAANNHGIVHSGYMAYRKELLKAGVKIYEVKATESVAGVERGGAGASLATLHTKAFLVDSKRLFVGSFNWDPRSANINTELGVIMNSEVIGEKARRLVEEGLPKRAYEVKLDGKGGLQWIDSSGFEPRIETKEPDTSWWRRTKAQLGRLLPVRGQL